MVISVIGGGSRCHMCGGGVGSGSGGRCCVGGVDHVDRSDNWCRLHHWYNQKHGKDNSNHGCETQ